jgi:hypothetical protein
MHPRRTATLLLLLPLLIPLLVFAVSTARAQARTAAPALAPAQSPTPPRPGVVLVRPSLAQLRPLVGRVVRITLIDGKQIQARLLSAWPGVVRVTFADGRAGAVSRHRIRSVTHLGPRFLLLSTQDATDSGKLFAYLGLGLTLGGLLLGGAAAPPLFVVGDRQQCPGILDCVPPATTAAIFVTALSASALAAGLGSALLGASASDPDRLGALRWSGAIIAPLGVFVALCIGLPMWMEAIRKGPTTTNAHREHSAPPPRTLEDPHHQRAWNARHRPTPPGATFAYGWRWSVER